MSPDQIKAAFFTAVEATAANIDSFAAAPGKDFTRSRKLPPEKLIPFLVAEGSASTKNEMLDFFGLDPNGPTDSAFNQQRAKLHPDALKDVLDRFNASLEQVSPPPSYRYLAADGSTATFFSTPKYASPEYYVSEGHSARGFYSIHINALYDLDQNIYPDALLQPVHNKDEFSAFCELVDRRPVLPNTKDVFIGDRGYCSYNNMAHVTEKRQYFLFRTKDINSKGLVQGFSLPKTGSFDETVHVTLTRSNSSNIKVVDSYRRFIGKKVSFDYIEYGSLDTYELSFRVVRFPLDSGDYECLVTNLPIDEFPLKSIKKLYFRRWGIETSFRLLKYTIGLSNFHSYKPDQIQQEIWGRLIMYNITESLVNLTVISNEGKKYAYKVNFSVAVHVCRAFLRPNSNQSPADVLSRLQRELVPIRDERKYKRSQTAHFRKPRYFLYRAA